ncbi:cobalamin-binding protein [Paenibacillus sp. ACRRX]|uniref:ABC transporter substrate-binding protein n=1 Tax=unclassified Paenibacillus TaxID=185978 RepID=UPI001EF54CD7|nr:MULTISPECIES: cobalamin-binding protein [unclassified Paenibacillus]MCG7409979.1 cobalamin-binding protein [Paenibacillus sp. ACRRX]MDK8182956.1 cobalamin-binding protein [Paenibacillus sp. UMB4589-SE434]
MKPWWNRTLAALMVCVLAVSLAACGGAKEEGTPAPDKQQEQTGTETSTDALKTTYPLTVKDVTGEEFKFDKAPERIVSVSPAETESLFALGLDSQIAGVSDYDDYPEAAKTKAKMGGIMKPNEEAIIAAKPDIVFTGISMKEDVVKKFRDLGITIFKVEPKSFDDVLKNIELYGLITDRQQQAKDIVEGMKKTRDDIQTAVKDVTEKKKVYIEFSPGWTVGSGEFMNELIELAGGVNVAADAQGWVQINEENIIKSNPDVIMFTQGIVDSATNKTLEEIIRGRKGWENINAIKNNQVIGVDSNLISRPGPRVAEGLKIIAKAIYPDLIK